MATPENPMAYLLEFTLRKIERDRPEIANDQKYAELKVQLLQDADGHFREVRWSRSILTLVEAAG